MDGLKLQAKAVSKAGRGLRSLFSNAPKSAVVIDRAARLLRRKVPGAVAVSTASISLDLHPAVEPVEISVTADGELTIAIAATALGPGYVRYVVGLLDTILEEIDFVWQPDGDSYPSRRDEAALDASFTTWLHIQLTEVIAGRGRRQLAMPQYPRYETDAAVLTPTGPRSLAWCEAAVLDPRAGNDFFLWWGRPAASMLPLARALWLLWMEVPWRPPIGDLERELMEQAHRELTQSHKLAPAGELPWPEWAELVDYLDLDDDVTEEVRTRGAPGTATIGYRRYQARFDLAAGWSVRLSPNFADSWQDDGASMVATDGDRSIRCSCAEAEGESAGQILAKIPMLNDVVARFDKDGYQGRVEARNDESNGVRVLTAIMATAGSAAVITAVLLQGGDEWAIETWQTLRRDPASDDAAPEGEVP